MNTFASLSCLLPNVEPPNVQSLLEVQNDTIETTQAIGGKHGIGTASLLFLKLKYEKSNQCSNLQPLSEFCAVLRLALGEKQLHAFVV